MHFNLAPFLAFIPIVAGMALPSPATDAVASSNVRTLADGSVCLAVELYYDRYFGPGNAGLPGCGTLFMNRVSRSLLSLVPLSLG